MIKRYLSLTPEDREKELLALVAPLLEFFAEIDDIFTEDDALSPAKRQMGMGRAYRAWKRVRVVMDPEWDPKLDRRGPDDPSRRTGKLVAVTRRPRDPARHGTNGM